MREAHQQALSTVAALEEEIGRLDQIRACSQSRVRSRSWDCQRSKGEGQKKRHHQVSFVDELAPIRSTYPEMLSGEEGFEGRDSDLGKLQGTPETSDEEGKKMPPIPLL